MKTIKIFSIVPRLNKETKEIELYFLDERKDLTCFCFSEGHNTASYGYYRQKTSQVSKANEKEVSQLYTHYKNIPDSDNCKFVLRQRLRSVKTIKEKINSQQIEMDRDIQRMHKASFWK